MEIRRSCVKPSLKQRDDNGLSGNNNNNMVHYTYYRCKL